MKTDRPTNQSREVFSAQAIAQFLAEPGELVLTPTLEQQQVIEHPPAGATLVVAGAGSGKTETIANRVVWLIANGHALPGEILGLTFTRKAAGELAERVRTRVMRFAERVTVAAEGNRLGPAQRARAHVLDQELNGGLELPEVSTYNSFAVRIVQEFGAAAGISSSATLLDEASAWSLAREVVISSDDPQLAARDLSLNTLVDQVLALDRAVHEHLTTFERVSQLSSEFARITKLPYNNKELATGATGKVYKDVHDIAVSVGQTELVASLAKRFSEEKRRRGVLEFSDQVALAMKTIEKFPDAKRVMRERSRVVLLDEIQDTSVGQTALLAQLYSGLAVMGVGDPHQSIYGWRGASSENLTGFHRTFAGPSGGKSEPTTLTLSTSWRNAQVILDVANMLSEPLRAESAIDVPVLTARPAAPVGSVHVAYPEKLSEEAEIVASWVREQRNTRLREEGRLPTTAVIFRKKEHMGAFSAALTHAGVPNQIVGVGGLLSTPEITDIVSTLRCLWYADAGSDLIRILTGPRFRIGPRDLRGLQAVGRWFSGRDHAHKRIDPATLTEPSVLEQADRLTLIDALDKVADCSEGHPALDQLTTLGRHRLHEAAFMLRELRSLVGIGIIDLIKAVEHALRLDIELAANERTAHIGAAARTNLDLFTNFVDAFLVSDEEASLRSVLNWLDRSSREDDAAEYVPTPERGTVQLITAHSAKGLEWDIVAIPRLVTGEFPSANRDGKGWLRAGKLPDECRGDRATRPVLNWRLAETQQELISRVKDYGAENAENFFDEERRLAYVAVTRSRSSLLLSGSFWSKIKTSRAPSEYLCTLSEKGMIDRLPEASQYEERPVDDHEITATWPLDPLGARAHAVHQAAHAVNALLQEGEQPTPQPVAPEVQLLLNEMSHRDRPQSLESIVPERINASTFHEFIADAKQTFKNHIRPVPSRPYRQTRVGNLFHDWVEQRTTTALGTALELPLPGDEDTGVDDTVKQDLTSDDAQLERLKYHFEHSRWAVLSPIAVEQEVSISFSGRRIVCKLDAVYRFGDRVHIVDWKTGRPPKTSQEREQRFLQLDLYRLAFAEHADVDPAQIDVSLYYVAADVELSGGPPRTILELEKLWQQSVVNDR